MCNVNREVPRILRFGVLNYDDWKFGVLGKVPYTPTVFARIIRRLRLQP
jgi:hypothetical protein